MWCAWVCNGDRWLLYYLPYMTGLSNPFYFKWDSLSCPLCSSAIKLNAIHINEFPIRLAKWNESSPIAFTQSHVSGTVVNAPLCWEEVAICLTVWTPSPPTPTPLLQAVSKWTQNNLSPSLPLPFLRFAGSGVFLFHRLIKPKPPCGKRYHKFTAQKEAIWPTVSMLVKTLPPTLL